MKKIRLVKQKTTYGRINYLIQELALIFKNGHKEEVWVNRNGTLSATENDEHRMKSLFEEYRLNDFGYPILEDEMYTTSGGVDVLEEGVINA